MSESLTDPGSARTLRAYRIYIMCRDTYFWMPLFFLYFIAHLPLEQVLLLESLYYVAVVLLEVPSGVASDRFGRRPVLILSSLGFLCSYALFFGVRGSLLVWGVAQVALAVGVSFSSGSDTSLLRDALVEQGRGEEYGEQEARLGRVGLWSMAIGSVLGGVIGWKLGLAWAYGASVVSALGALGATLAMREPAHTVRGELPAAQLTASFSLLGDGRTRWLFLAGSALMLLVHIPYEFYQPYLALVSRPLTQAEPALLSGAHAALALLLGGWVSGHSVRWSARMGVRATLLLGVCMQGVVIALMGWWLHPVLALLLVGRAVPMGFARAPLLQALMKRIPGHLSATTLSLLSLTGRLGCAIWLAVLSQLVHSSQAAATWPAISVQLLTSACLGAALLLLLGVLGRPLVFTPPLRSGEDD